MTVGEGQFLLYSYITPALKAGDYRFDVAQTLTAKKGTDPVGADELPIDPLQTHVRVTAPRYQLPPDQVLSTYPPAGTEGAYGSRLPQIVIKRRTLPWERGLTVSDGHGGQLPVDERTPWLALVLIAEGEAELRLNQPVSACVTPGVVLEGAADVAQGNCLVVRQSVLEKLLPSRKDVPLLAHAREVDIHDTELMMGDDDGFLAVVISNRLPVGGVDAEGNATPVKYLACLINLEGQFDQLIPESPPAIDVLQLFGTVQERYVDAGVYDHVAGGGRIEDWGRPGALDAQVLATSTEPLAEPLVAPLALSESLVVRPDGRASATYSSNAGYRTQTGTDVYEVMARDFAHAPFVLAEQEHTFPVLLHWSFTSTGSVTFETLMRGLDSGLQGDEPEHPDPNATGRPPLEVVETGHVGLTHRTRRGDTVRSWYRGPLLPHPSSGERLAIAHSSDQLRSVIPDGREDISLATAFEIGRLLALSRPAMVASLLRWRQGHFQTARLGAIWDRLREQLPFDDLLGVDGLRLQLESKLRELIAVDPDQLLGPPRVLVRPGDPVDWGKNPLKVMGQGLGLDVDLSATLRTTADLGPVTADLRNTVPVVSGTFEPPTSLTDHLHADLDAWSDQLVTNVLANEITLDPALGAGVLRSPDLGTVVVRASDAGAIVNLPGGVLESPDADPPARLKRSRRPRPVDPLDALLAGTEDGAR